MARLVKLSGEMAVSPRRKYSPRLPREQRREQLLDAALALITAHGYGGASMEAVAREADIAKTVVYDAFGNRHGLLKALLEREQDRVLSAIAEAMPTPPLSGDPGELLTAGFSGVLEAVRANPDTWRLILLPADGTPQGVRAEVNRHRARILRQLEPMVQWGAPRLGLGHLDHELAAEAILALVENAARLTLTQPRRYPPERIARFSADLLAGVAPGGPGTQM
ncbi:MAG: TetR/AcrR family transcriptional regulator [Thermoleophilaceae bacterium]